jgi:Ca-activated chloride channel homolog
MSRFFNIAVWQYDFYSPGWLWALLAIPVIFIAYHLLTTKSSGHIRFSRSEAEQREMGTGSVRYYRWAITIALVFSMSCLVVTLARPYHASFDPPHVDYKNGIDIILAIDISGSMLAQDFDPNRLEVAKNVAIKFVNGRKGDRVGLVVYEGEAFTACPATLDYTVLKEQISRLEPGMLGGGTAIGDGLGVAVTRLRSDSLKSKVIILLTDGSNNEGMDPLEAAELARNKNCRVYTIGVGSNGLAPAPVPVAGGISYQPTETDIDEGTLKSIADMTGGKYFRATDDKSLEKIYDEIDRMEKRKMEDQHFGAEPPVTVVPFLLWSLIFLLAAWALRNFKFRLDD